eukprot:1408384-Rhodomonas_salina.1
MDRWLAGKSSAGRARAQNEASGDKTVKRETTAVLPVSFQLSTRCRRVRSDARKVAEPDCMCIEDWDEKRTQLCQDRNAEGECRGKVTKSGRKYDTNMATCASVGM